MVERGVTVDASTIWRWMQRYAPQLEKEIRWYQGYSGPAWQNDETCIRVKGVWKWLFRAIDREGRTSRPTTGRSSACAGQRSASSR